MIVYNKFWELCKEKEVSTYYLRLEGISPRVIQKLRSGGCIDTTTINRLCELIHCQPGDIMEYKKD